MSLELAGSPSGFGEVGGNPYQWRVRLRAAARAALSGVDLPLSQPVKLVIRFAVLSSAKGHDIDNLLKPTIDGLGAAGLFAQSSSGGVASEWNTEDGWVYAVDAEKELVEEGAFTRVDVYI